MSTIWRMMKYILKRMINTKMQGMVIDAVKESDFDAVLKRR